MASTDVMRGTSITNVTTPNPPTARTVAGDRQLTQSADVPELPLSDAVEPPFDIEHVLVQDDPRKWSPFRKVR